MKKLLIFTCLGVLCLACTSNQSIIVLDGLNIKLLNPMPGSYAGGYDYTTGFTCGYSYFSPYRLIFVWMGNLIEKSQDEFTILIGIIDIISISAL